MQTQDLTPLTIILLFTVVVFLYVLRMHNPKLTTVTMGPLFLYLVAGVLGTTQLYIMATMVLSICVVCFLFAHLSLRGLTVSRTATSPVSKGDMVEIALDVVNRDWMPKIFLRVRCPLPKWLRAEQDTFVIPGLWPGQRTVCRLRAEATKRGCYALAPLQITGADPLDIFQRVTHLPAPLEIVVYPSLGDAPGLDLWGDDLFGALPARRTLRPAAGLDFRSLRDFQSGDDVRTIDWKATARMARLIVVEFEPTQVGDLTVLVDNRAGVQAGRGEQSTLEHAVAAAAGCLAAVLEVGGTVRLRALDGSGVRDITGHGADNHPRLLDALARIEGSAGSLVGLAPLDVAGRAALLVTPGSDAEVTEAVRAIVASGGRPVVILLDARAFAGADTGPEPGVGSALLGALGVRPNAGPTGVPAEVAAGHLRGCGARVLLLGPNGPVRERAPAAAVRH